MQQQTLRGHRVHGIPALPQMLRTHVADRGCWGIEANWGAVRGTKKGGHVHTCRPKDPYGHEMGSGGCTQGIRRHRSGGGRLRNLGGIRFPDLLRMEGRGWQCNLAAGVSITHPAEVVLHVHAQQFQHTAYKHRLPDHACICVCYTEKAPNTWHRRGTQKTRNTYNQPNRPNRQTSQTKHQALPKGQPGRRITPINTAAVHASAQQPTIITHTRQGHH